MSIVSSLFLLKALSTIQLFGSFAIAFATAPQRHHNIKPSKAMAPNPSISHPKNNFGTFTPLAMIPDSRNQMYEQDRNSTSSRPPTFLDATKRRREARAETQELIPEIPKGESALSQLSNVAQSITNAVASLVDSVASSKKLQGRAILLLVSFLYGTLNVTLRGIYATEGPPVASVLSLVRQVLSVIAFLPLLAFSKDEGRNELALNGDELESGSKSGDVAEIAEKPRPMWMAALELAFWNFGAQVSCYFNCTVSFLFLRSINFRMTFYQGLINAGLLSSPAARAAFLTQTSVVMTPLLSRFAGESIKNSVWGGCVLALG